MFPFSARSTPVATVDTGHVTVRRETISLPRSHIATKNPSRRIIHIHASTGKTNCNTGLRPRVKARFPGRNSVPIIWVPGGDQDSNIVNRSPCMRFYIVLISLAHLGICTGPTQCHGSVLHVIAPAALLCESKAPCSSAWIRRVQGKLELLSVTVGLLHLPRNHRVKYLA